MNLAFAQARKNLGNTKENPSVGCVVVKNEILLSAGFTSFNGRPHAETNALKYLKKKSQDSILYTTLEPCVHYGKTPPCVDLIKSRKIKKVFYAVKDPDLRTYNKSAKFFKSNGIRVSHGILSNKLNNFYKSYFNFKGSNAPFVTAKIALSKDHYSVNKKKSWITNIYSRGRVHLMRSQHDCIITSSKTVIEDNPTLNCRIPGLENRSPTRVILDRELKIPIKSKILRTAKIYKTIIFYNKYNYKKLKLLKKFKVSLIYTDLDNKGNLDLLKLLKKLKKIGYSRIFLESGIKLVTAFLKQKLINELKIFISKKSINKLGSIKSSKIINYYLKRKNINFEQVNLFGDKLKSYIIK